MHKDHLQPLENEAWLSELYAKVKHNQVCSWKTETCVCKGVWENDVSIPWSWWRGIRDETLSLGWWKWWKITQGDGKLLYFVASLSWIPAFTYLGPSHEKILLEQHSAQGVFISSYHKGQGEHNCNFRRTFLVFLTQIWLSLFIQPKTSINKLPFP